MTMTPQEAFEVGRSKLGIGPALFWKCVKVARQIDGMRSQDVGPMALSLALLGVSRAHKSDAGLQSELSDALQTVAAAEREWRLEKEAEEAASRLRLN